MGKGVKLWLIWLAALATGIYGTSLIFNGITTPQHIDLVYGIPVLLMGVWVTGNIFASARQMRHRFKTSSH
ncbi:hypothetical protein D2Q93_06930 [Alicyclobacillaceae bacterium I2511]|nr:hypothetical protein D2Q93_06930 [Alicyclobacillaceae bacterium I2511]